MLRFLKFVFIFCFAGVSHSIAQTVASSFHDLSAAYSERLLIKRQLGDLIIEDFSDQYIIARMTDATGGTKVLVLTKDLTLFKVIDLRLSSLYISLDKGAKVNVPKIRFVKDELTFFL